MKHLNAYSTVAGELPKMVAQGKAAVMIPMSDVWEFKEAIVKIMSDRTHTQYQNECYLNFLLRRVGML